MARTVVSLTDTKIKSEISKILFKYVKNVDINNRSAWLVKQFAKKEKNF